MTRWLFLLLLSIALGGAGPKLPTRKINSIGIIAALGDTCMFERIPNASFEWIAPPQASFLEISDWGIDDDIAKTVATLLGARYRIQSIAIEHQDFDTWNYESLGRNIRNLPLPQSPVDAYLVVLRDWRGDEIGKSGHEVAGLGLYRRDLRGGGERLGIFASYRLVLLDPDTGNVVASRPALLPNGALPWLPVTPALWPRTQNDLGETQRRQLQSDFMKLIDDTLPHALRALHLHF